MLNIDRWAYYTAQQLRLPTKDVLSGRYDGPWIPKFKPAQRRRIFKKSRKNNDHSIGMF